MKLDEAKRKICKLENAYATLSQSLEQIRSQAMETSASNGKYRINDAWLVMTTTKALTQAEIEKDNLL